MYYVYDFTLEDVSGGGGGGGGVDTALSLGIYIAG